MPRQDTQQIAPRIAANIRIARGDRSQRQLAKELDVDPSYVSRWEMGKVMPSFASIEALARATDRPAEWFFVDHDQTGVAA
jgi:transcriptional regulator with XRE-family HTH domain